jgi:hypothetical protein
LQCVEAVVQRQQRVASEGDTGRLIFDTQRGGAGILGSHRSVGDGQAFTPFGDGLHVDAVPGGEGTQALLTALNCATSRLCRAGAAVE